MSRHAILYDVVRWRRNRLWLVPPAAVCYGFSIVTAAVRPADGIAAPWALVGSVLLAWASSMWVRQRFCDVSVRDGGLQVRIAAVKRRIPLSEVRRARVARLGTVLTTPARRRVLPRGGAARTAAWLDTESVVLRLGDGVDAAALRRVVGRRLIVDRDLVIPVVDPAGLVAEIDDAMPARPVVGPPRRRRRR